MKPVTDAVPDIGVRARRFSLRSPPAWCVVQWPINCSHKGKISIFPGTKIARLIAAAGKPCSPHLLTTLSFIPFCFFPVSLSANHQALQVFFFYPRSHSFTFHFFPPPIIPSSSNGYCVSSGGERAEKEGGWECVLACRTVETGVSVSNDALIINTLEQCCCTEPKHHLMLCTSSLFRPVNPLSLFFKKNVIFLFVLLLAASFYIQTFCLFRLSLHPTLFMCKFPCVCN